MFSNTKGKNDVAYLRREMGLALYIKLMIQYFILLSHFSHTYIHVIYASTIIYFPGAIQSNFIAKRLDTMRNAVVGRKYAKIALHDAVDALM